MITGTMAALILGLSLLGMVGFGGLLIVGLKMWEEERAAKRAAPEPAPTPVPLEPAEAAPETEAAPAEAAAMAPPPPEPDPAPLTEAVAPVETAEASPEAPPAELAPEAGAPLSPPPAAELEARPAALRLPFLSRAPTGQELLRVSRDPATGQFTITIAGRPCANYQDIRDPAGEQAFMMAYRLLQDFSENAIVAPASDAGDAQPSTAAPVVYRASELPPIEVPTMQPFQQFRKTRGKQPTPATKFVVKSITEQIEDHLQDKIARTPLARRGVHVRADTQGNAIFLLDGKIYPAVDLVPDPEVQQAIRAAIAEWEQKK